MRVGRGRKMKSPGIAAIVSGVPRGAVHEVERAPYEVVEESYALGQVLILHMWRRQGCRSERGSPSMRERSQDVRRHLSEAAHPADAAAKFALVSATHRREHHHRLGFVIIRASG